MEQIFGKKHIGFDFGFGSCFGTPTPTTLLIGVEPIE